MLAMSLAEGIRKHGFRKWYERELLRSHAHLALVFVCMVGILVAIDAASRLRSWADQFTDGLSLLLCAGVGLWALRRYLHLLMHAETVAKQADCARCKAYGRIALLRSDARGDCVQVQCRKCGHVWHIDG
jgi:ABC-type nickel/cobalt efflux system permease component RcnA